MGTSYENRIIGFVDILGSSDRVLADTQGTFAKAVHKVVSTLSGRNQGIWFSVPHVRTGEEIKIQVNGRVGQKDKITTISDGIVISCPAIESENGLALGSKTLPILKCLEVVSWLQSGLLCVGLRSRGGMCFGRLIHTNSFVFGEGIVRAHRLESRDAINPRTIIHQDVIETLISEPVPDKLALFKTESLIWCV